MRTRQLEYSDLILIGSFYLVTVLMVDLEFTIGSEKCAHVNNRAPFFNCLFFAPPHPGPLVFKSVYLPPRVTMRVLLLICMPGNITTFHIPGQMLSAHTSSQQLCHRGHVLTFVVYQFVLCALKVK